MCTHIVVIIDTVNVSLLYHSSHTGPYLFSVWALYHTQAIAKTHNPTFMCYHTHTHAHRNSWGACWRVTWNAHNGSGGINFSHFICLLLHEEQLGWQRHNKQDIVVSGFLLRLLMPHADLYIKTTESAVRLCVQHCYPPIYSTVRQLCCTPWTAWIKVSLCRRKCVPFGKTAIRQYNHFGLYIQWNKC